MRALSTCSLLSSLPLLASCAMSGTGPITLSGSPARSYTVEVDRAPYGVAATVHYGASMHGAAGAPVRHTETGPYPDTVSVEWEFRGAYNNNGPTQRWRATLPVKSVLPPDFGRHDRIRFVARGDGIAYVEFLVEDNARDARVGDRHGPLSVERLPDAPCSSLYSSDPCGAPGAAASSPFPGPPPLELEQQQKDEALFQAVRTRDLAALKRALTNGAEPYQRWRRQDQPEFMMIHDRWLDGIEAFNTAGHPLRGESLLVPIVRDWMDVLEALLKGGTNPNVMTALCPRPQDPAPGLRGCRDSPKYPVIFNAIQHDEPEMVRLLLEHGASLDFKVDNEMQAMEWVRQHGSSEMRRAIADAAGRRAR